MMVAKSTVMLSIGTLVLAYYASSAKVSHADFMNILNNETLEYKHHRCYWPSKHTYVDPHKVPYHLANQTIKRWFYDPYTKACRPLFTYPNFTYTPENKNYNLPHTRIECEALCSTICLVDHANRKFEMGICMSFGFGAGLPNSCKDVLSEAHPKQCQQSYSKCCPRSYQDLINTPVTSTVVQFDNPPKRRNKSMAIDNTLKLESHLYNIGSFSE